MATTLQVVVAVFVNCLLITPAVKASSQTMRFFNIGLNNFIFKSSLEFESKARSVSDCARQCSSDARCVTFTYVTGSPSGSCRGHSATFNATSDHSVSATRAKTFTELRLLLPVCCTNYTVLDDYRRDVNYTATSDLEDDELQPGWYRFLLNGANAVMPTSCVVWWRCGTIGGLWLNLPNGVLPGVGEEKEGIGCMGCDSDCYRIWFTNLTVVNCLDFFVYFLNPVPVASERSYCVTTKN